MRTRYTPTPLIPAPPAHCSESCAARSTSGDTALGCEVLLFRSCSDKEGIVNICERYMIDFILYRLKKKETKNRFLWYTHVDYRSSRGSSDSSSLPQSSFTVAALSRLMICQGVEVALRPGQVHANHASMIPRSIARKKPVAVELLSQPAVMPDRVISRRAFLRSYLTSHVIGKSYLIS
ncbi:hypothetical protein EVAR_100628_1 [Eumeta japonica]|uniref:Uncharacterized protein n=1 Tax=Eumeta variegata TaxID=151549 RepID=A0A4C2A411_EUMVA|nr:hypothetical protein EVAR_100628_1 [Eumeta japonica]